MLEELQRRNYSKSTTRYYLQAVANFARHFGKSPDKLGPDELRSYQAYLLRERKLAVGTVIARVAALRRPCHLSCPRRFRSRLATIRPSGSER